MGLDRTKLIGPLGEGIFVYLRIALAAPWTDKILAQALPGMAHPTDAFRWRAGDQRVRRHVLSHDGSSRDKGVGANPMTAYDRGVGPNGRPPPDQGFADLALAVDLGPRV